VVWQCPPAVEVTAPLRFLKADTAENVELFAHGGIIKENLVERRDVGLKSLGQADVAASPSAAASVYATRGFALVDLRSLLEAEGVSVANSALARGETHESETRFRSIAARYFQPDGMGALLSQAVGADVVVPLHCVFRSEGNGSHDGVDLTHVDYPVRAGDPNWAQNLVAPWWSKWGPLLKSELSVEVCVSIPKSASELNQPLRQSVTPSPF
jgi:hypothetical protein